MSVKVKICGLTREKDVRAAIDSGADVLGFVFATSARSVSIEQAVKLLSPVPGPVLSAGLFMNQSASDVHGVLGRVKLDLLQFHGSESEQFCLQFGLPYLKAISMLSRAEVGKADKYPSAAGILLDAHAPGAGGGTGKTFDWSQTVSATQPIWLAGGLNADNVSRAVQQVRPYAVDVSSGVEEAPGIKDHRLMKLFINNARQE